jgi:NAD(P)-dependent dehydrogenase (short-subunit alcohol dehydrogenase family)
MMYCALNDSCCWCSVNAYDLHGRVALVTGGASGLGAAVAAALRSAGAKVAIFDRDPRGVEGAIRGDISQSVDVDAAVRRVADELGGIDILVNCAGIGGPWRSGLELSDEDWAEIMAINATGAFNVCRAAIPEMVRRGYGRVVLLSSIAGKEGSPLLPAYSAAKAAVIALAKSFARDVAGSGVLVNVVTPAVFETPMSTDLPAQTQQRMVSAVPLGRMGRPAEAAALISWLSSEDCSFSTGAVFDLSGGRSTY